MILAKNRENINDFLDILSILEYTLLEYNGVNKRSVLLSPDV